MAGRSTDQGKVIQYIRLRPISSEEVKEILIGINMKTMLLDNYTQFGTNGSNNIFSVDNYEINVSLDTELFNIDGQEFLGFYRL